MAAMSFKSHSQSDGKHFATHVPLNLNVVLNIHSSGEGVVTVVYDEATRGYLAFVTMIIQNHTAAGASGKQNKTEEFGACGGSS